MHRKKKTRERYSIRRAFGWGTQQVQEMLYGNPSLHFERGKLEIENCGKILEYTAHRLKVQQGKGWVLAEGDGLMLAVCRKSQITVCGRIFSVQFGAGEDRNDGTSGSLV